MDVQVEHSVEDFLRLEGIAGDWRARLGQIMPEQFPEPSWVLNAKIFGHGPKMKPEPDNETHNVLSPWEKWEELGRIFQKIRETKGEYRIPGIDY
jgi:hypothetical protein